MAWFADCDSAWNKDPVFGVIGIQTGPRERGSTVASMAEMGAGFGMLIVETIAKIRRAYFAQQKPIKTICREFRVSRKVVREGIRSQATEFRYERGHPPLPRLDPWRNQLDELRLANEANRVVSG